MSRGTRCEDSVKNATRKTDKLALLAPFIADVVLKAISSPTESHQSIQTCSQIFSMYSIVIFGGIFA